MKKVKQMKVQGGSNEGRGDFAAGAVAPLTEFDFSVELGKVYRLIARQVRAISRDYGLTSSQESDLYIDVVSNLLTHMGLYRPEAGALSTFVLACTRSFLVDWCRREVIHRRIFVPMTDEVALICENFSALSSGRDELERLVLGGKVRRVVSRLKGLPREVCRQYLKTPSLKATQEALGISRRSFYHSVWPRTRKAFIQLWKDDSEKKD